VTPEMKIIMPFEDKVGISASAKVLIRFLTGPGRKYQKE